MAILLICNGVMYKDIAISNFFFWNWDRILDKGIIWDGNKLNTHLYVSLLNSHFRLEFQYRMPDAYDQEGGVNQEKRFSVAMQRYRYWLTTWSSLQLKKYKKKKKRGWIWAIFMIPFIMYSLRFLSHWVGMNFQKVLALLNIFNFVYL